MTDGEKYASLDTLMSDFYSAISFAPGEEPDWDLLRLLFLPGATLVPPKGPETRHARGLSLEAFIQRATLQMDSKPDLRRQGFREKEIARRMESYDTVVHVFSTYSGSFWNESKTIARGINSIQVLLDDARWWIVSILWSDETEANPIPRKYLRSKQL